MKDNFSELERGVMFEKATERAFSGEYDAFFKEGNYVCKNCNQKLYSSKDKFDAGCGWPAFDDCYPDAVKRVLDDDGRRVEILCNNCGIHLGHVFEGERLTEKNTRHCVNSVSIKFVPESILKHRFLVVGCGCFWGVDYWFKKLDGVLETTVGYSGGNTINPTYEDVLTQNTGHKEVLKIEFDEDKVTFEKLVKYFFEIHDFTQNDGQGNDVGDQYKSVLFYQNDEEKNIFNSVIDELKNKRFDVKTELLEYKEFYKAETYHQNYYGKNGQVPYCHFYKKIF
jgi:peptide methionine sulfoxide reductase msrA/msrB